MTTAGARARERLSALSGDDRARAALSRLCEPDDVGLGQLVDRLGAEQVLAQIGSGELPSGRLAAYQARLTSLDPDAELERAAGFGARLVTPGSEEWPVVLDDLGPRRPLALWVTGSGDLAHLGGRAVAVVGARACTAYGEHVAAELAAGLGERGWTVVSGAAFGIDAAAHRGALAVDGGTVAVLACGADVVYPSAHARLLSAVRGAGVVVSELPPGCRPTRSRFLGRNRVIAALGRGTVVVEAALRSGAMNTAGHAADLSREVMAVPGPVTSPMSAGCHELVRGAAASLVTDAADVLDLVGDMGVDAGPLRRGEVRPHDGLDDLTMRVLDALPVRQRAGPASIARVAGLDAASVLRALAVLSVRGLADNAAGAWRRAPATGAKR
ncbi:MAG: processing protein [Actinomycetota bacterium]|nr:processing protein [Actinomycetota bacterium]